MPARTVVFTNLRKYDGKDWRQISSGEFIQMSGRAGRRGIDDRGITITMINSENSPTELRKMYSGKADTLNSSFHLSYYMILNLLRVEEITPEYIMERSFLQYQSEKQKPDLENKLDELIKTEEGFVIENEAEIKEYHSILDNLNRLKIEFRNEITQPIFIVQFIQPGRMIYVKDGENDYGWGIIVNFQKKKNTSPEINQQKATDYFVDVLLICEPFEVGKRGKPLPSKDGDMIIIPIQMDLIEKISTIRVTLPKSLKSAESRLNVKLKFLQTLKNFLNNPPCLDPIEDMKIKGDNFKKLIKKIENCEDQLSDLGFDMKKNIKNFETFMKKVKVSEEIEEVRIKLKKTSQLILNLELGKMKRVCRRLGLTSKQNVIEKKGRVACEISAGDELVLTEIMFNGMFNDLSPEVAVALLSCFVCEEKFDSTKLKLSKDLEKPYTTLVEAAKYIADVSTESKIEINKVEFIESFSPALMEVTYAWCNGAKFYEICKMTDIFEGSIVRMMRRLEELIRQLCNASKSIGDEDLEKKFLTGIEKIKRDIVFSASLYI
jgi:ATP-dependent RNA helicase DOB1